jgi:peptidoglycan hydrolase-like protein with peptidoglycan-binding domain
VPHDLDQAYRASLQRSRSRRRALAERVAAVRRRRRRRSGGASAGVIAIVLAAGVPLALAHQSSPAPSGTGGSPAAAALARGSSGGDVQSVQRALGVRVTGLYDARTRRAVRRFQRRMGLTRDGIVGPQTRAALGIAAPAGTAGAAAAPPATTGAPSGDAPAILARIAQCESGGDPTAVSPGGHYRGKYQFTRATWAQLGGAGDPAAAPEAEQDARAADLLAQRGTDPWPACGDVAA